MGVCLKCYVIDCVNSEYVNFESVRMKTVIITYIKTQVMWHMRKK